MITTLQRIKQAGVLSLNDAMILEALKTPLLTLNGIMDETRIIRETATACTKRLIYLGLIARAGPIGRYGYYLTEKGREIFEP